MGILSFRHAERFDVVMESFDCCLAPAPLDDLGARNSGHLSGD
jgi:hypothetical protein